MATGTRHISLDRPCHPGQRVLTVGEEVLEEGADVGGLRFAHRLEFLGVGDLHVGSHVRGMVPQEDLEVLVPEDGLVIAEDGVREFRFEGGNVSQAGW